MVIQMSKIITKEWVISKIEYYMVPEHIAKQALNYVTKKPRPVKTQKAIEMILRYGIYNPNVSFATMVERIYDMSKHEPWNTKINRNEANYILSIASAFISTNRDDYDTYAQYLGARRREYMKDGYGEILGVPYIYSIDEQKILDRLVNYVNNTFTRSNKLAQNPWFCVYIVRCLYRNQHLTKNKRSLENAINDLIVDFNKTLNKYVDALMSIRPSQSIFVNESDLLTPKDFIEYMYQRRWYNYSGLPMSRSEQEKEMYNHLYVDYQSPSEVEKIFDLKKKCDTYIMYIGEYHKETLVQNFGYDPRFGFGEVPLPFDVAIISENQLVVPPNLRDISINWNTGNMVELFYKAIAKVGFDFNKMVICMQILENRPITGYATKVNARMILKDDQIVGSFNLQAVRLLYDDLSAIADSMSKTDEESKKTFEKIVKIRKYLFGTEKVPNVTNYPSDLRRPYEESPLWAPLKEASSSDDKDMKNDSKSIIPYVSFHEIVESRKYNPQKDMYYYYRFIVQWNTIYMEAVQKALYYETSKKADNIKKDAENIRKQGSILLVSPKFNELVDEYVENCEVDWRISYINLVMRHPEMDQDVDLSLVQHEYDKYDQAFVEAKAKTVHDTAYKVLRDCITDFDINRNCPIYNFMIACRQYRTDHMSTTLIKDHVSQFLNNICDYMHSNLKKDPSLYSSYDFVRDLTFDTDIPYGFTEWDWPYIKKLFDDHPIADTRIGPIPFQNDITTENMHKLIYITCFLDVMNAGFIMRIKQILESPNPPKLIVIPCGDHHVVTFQSLFMAKAQKDGFKLHKPKLHKLMDLDKETDPDNHVQ